MTSIYFTVTTITTVGYGDMSASTTIEKIVCIFIMLCGVVAFAMASGSLTNFITKSDFKSEQQEAKMNILEKLSSEHQIPQDLQIKIIKNIDHNDVVDAQAVA